MKVLIVFCPMLCKTITVSKPFNFSCDLVKIYRLKDFPTEALKIHYGQQIRII